jgi:hypothetical protein
MRNSNYKKNFIHPLTTYRGTHEYSINKSNNCFDPIGAFFPNDSGIRQRLAFSRTDRRFTLRHFDWRL